MNDETENKLDEQPSDAVQPDYSSAKGQSYSPYEGSFGQSSQYSSNTSNEEPKEETPKYTNFQNYSNYTVNDQSPKKKKNKSFKIWMTVICIVLGIALIFAAAFAGYTLASSNSSKTLTADDTVSSDKETNAAIDYDKGTNSTKSVSDGTVAGCAAVAVDSVVEITTESMATDYFYGQYVTSGAGSGVIIDDSNGYIVTCAHVVDGATSVKVTLTNEQSYEATIVGSDSETDIAVIKIEAEGLTAASIGDSDEVVLGENAVAIGNPLGTLGGTVTSGIISALDREITIDGVNYHLFQIDTAINPGNSGGGLFDIDGNLIGIVNAKSSSSSTSSTTIEGIGFAIPVNRAISVAEELVSNGYISGRPAMGITYVDITTSTSTSQIYSAGLYNYVTDYGVYFTGYSSGQSGDLQFGDRIVAYNGTSVSGISDIKSLLSESEVGETVKLTVSRKTSDMRSSQLVEVNITLIESTTNTADTTESTTSQNSYYNPFGDFGY